MNVDVCIIGGGLAGLSCARTLEAGGVETLLLEASDGWGGRVRTDEIDGHLVDRGYQVLLTAYPELDRQLDVAALDIAEFDPGAMVRAGGRFHRVQDPRRAPTSLIGTAVADIGTPLDKLRVLKLAADLVRGDPVDLLRAPDRSTRDALASRGFSSKMVERFWRPLLGGILLDTELEVSARRAEVILRMLAVGAAGVPRRGMGQIPAQMAASLAPDRVRLGASVKGIDGRRIKVTGGDEITANEVVVATDGINASRLLDLEDPGSSSVSCVWFSAERAPVSDKMIMLDGERSGPALNVAVMSNISPTYAPVGRSVIAAAVPGLATEGVHKQVLGQLRVWFGGEVDSWEHLTTQRIAHAHPGQAVGSSVKQAVAVGEHRWVCGDHRDTASIQGAMFSGRRTAERILARRI